MKLGKKVSVGFIFGGVITLLTSFDSSVLPWQIKLITGLGLFIYGLSGLIQGRMKETNELLQKWALPLIIIIIFFGVGGYYYSNSHEPHKTYDKLSGTFEVSFFGYNYPGTVLLESDRLTFQFGVPDSPITINDFTLSKDNKIFKKRAKWICALRKDFHVIHCSTSPMAIADYQGQFFDNGFFTIMFYFEDPLEVDSIEQISFVMHTNKGNKNILINSVLK